MDYRNTFAARSARGGGKRDAKKASGEIENVSGLSQSRIEPLFPKEPVPASLPHRLHAFSARPPLVGQQIFCLDKWPAAVTAFDRPIGPHIMAACASNNSICFPQLASRRIVLWR
jgi:hypothetical protein